MCDEIQYVEPYFVFSLQLQLQLLQLEDELWVLCMFVISQYQRHHSIALLFLSLSFSPFIFRIDADCPIIKRA